MLRSLMWVACIVLILAPFGIGVGVSLAVSLGWGVAIGSVALGSLALWVLHLDVLPGGSEER